MSFTDDMDLEKPTESSANAGESYNDNSDKLEKRTLKVTLGATISAFKWVYLDWGTKRYLEADSSTAIKKVTAGILLEGGDNGDERFICYAGRVTNPLWSFTSNAELYLSASGGDPVQTPPATKVLLGYPTDTDEMQVIPPVML